MKFRKKPIIVEAVQLPYSTHWEWPEIAKWCGGSVVVKGPTDDRRQAIAIPTLEGTMYASLGDWIIRGVKGEFYPCKPDIFEETYEEIEDD